jgi:hypothetical protein
MLNNLVHWGGAQQETVKWDEDVTQEFLKYLLIKLLPCLEQVHNEQRDELKVERSLQRINLHPFSILCPVFMLSE